MSHQADVAGPIAGSMSDEISSACPVSLNVYELVRTFDIGRGVDVRPVARRGVSSFKFLSSQVFHSVFSRPNRRGGGEYSK